jgi:hypothetical protein
MSKIFSILLGLAVVAATAGSAVANDKEVRALTIPASACTPGNEAVPNGASFIYTHWQLVRAAGSTRFASFACPLSLSNIRIGGTTATKISKFRVTYLDSDGNLAGPYVKVSLLSSKRPPGGDYTVLCSFDSNLSSNTSTTVTQATKACSVTLQAGTFYSFLVELRAGTPFGTTTAQFLGIDFPQ